MAFLLLVLPDFTTLNTSASLTPFTFGKGTSHLPCKKSKSKIVHNAPTACSTFTFFYKCTNNLTYTGTRKQIQLTAFSFRFCLIIFERTLALFCPSLSRRYAGTAPSGTWSSFFCFVFLSSCIFNLKWLWYCIKSMGPPFTRSVISRGILFTPNVKKKQLII